MINIITRDFSRTRGPNKVVRNLLKGLDKIGYPYVINKDINATKRCYIPNRRAPLLKLRIAKSKVTVGPNVYVLPHDIHWFVSLKNTIYLQPCEWTAQLWRELGFRRAPIKVRPTGIDTDEFHPKNGIQKKKILVYHKMRDKAELEMIEKTLQEMRLHYHKIMYGCYKEADYKEAIWQSSFIVWHGRHESQGIAMQEAMACNVPILVCDVKSLFEQRSGYSWPESLSNFKVTAAPYFDERCGLRMIDLSKLKQSIEYIFDNFSRFFPRDYVVENLSLEGQALKFVQLWEYWDLTVKQGYSEKLFTDTDYRDPTAVWIIKAIQKWRAG